MEICAQIRVLWVSQPSVEIVFAEAGSEHGKARLIDKIRQQADMLFLFHNGHVYPRIAHAYSGTRSSDDVNNF